MLILAISLGLIFLSSTFHFLGLKFTAHVSCNWNLHDYIVPPIMMFMVSLLHVIEVTVYAGAFMFLDQVTSLGGLGPDTSKFSFIDYFYLSGINYTTLGMVNYKIQGQFQILTVMEGLNGFMMLSWSATFFYSTIGKILQEEGPK